MFRTVCTFGPSKEKERNGARHIDVLNGLVSSYVFNQVLVISEGARNQDHHFAVRAVEGSNCSHLIDVARQLSVEAGRCVIELATVHSVETIWANFVVCDISNRKLCPP